MESQPSTRRFSSLPRRLPPALQVLLALTAVSAIFVGAGWGVARGDGADSLTTRLEPGLNYVGWVGREAPVEELFAAVPQIEAAFAWSTREERWLRAAPGMSAEINTLYRLTPGMGLVVKLGGDRAIEWMRRFTPASGVVELRSGLNLVAWVGGRARLLSEIDRDLRDSFQPLYLPRGTQTSARLHTPGQSELVDRFGVVEHGAALWVYATDQGSWTQRPDTRVEVRGRVVGSDGEGIGELHIYATMTSQPSRKFSSISDSDGSFGMSVIVDSEYTISVQHRPDCSSYYREDGTTEEPESATRIDTSTRVENIEFRIGDGACGRYIRGTLVDTAGAPMSGQMVSARAAIPEKGGWDRTAEDGSFEILVTDETEYVLRATVPGSCSVWYDGAGLTSVREDAATIRVSGEDILGVEIQVPVDVCALEIRGHVLKHDGTAYVGAKVYPNKVNYGTLQHSQSTSEDGSFSLKLAEPGLYRLLIYAEDDCSGYYADGALAPDVKDASTIEVTSDEVVEVVLRMPERSCVWQIRGRLTWADGSAIARTLIAAHGTDGTTKYVERTAADGSFRLRLRAEGPFRLSANVGDVCRVFRSNDGISVDGVDATRFARGISDVRDVEFALPAGVCESRVRGRIVHADGQPLAEAEMRLHGDQWISYANTRSDGTFDLPLPAAGNYQLRFELARGCRAFYDGETLSVSAPGEPGVQAGRARVTNLAIRIPEGLCAHQIRGVLVGPDGKPLGGRWVYADSEDGEHHIGNITKADGSFVVTVPVPGSYRVWAQLRDRCRAVYLEDGASNELDDGTIITVGDASVNDLVVRAPEVSCAWRIRGRIVHLDGSPLAEFRVTEWPTDGRSGTVRASDRDGSFEFTFAEETPRLLEVQLNNWCRVYYRDGGFSLVAEEATQFSPSEARQFDITMRIPEGLCDWRLEGRIVDPDGAPFAGAQVSAYYSNRVTNGWGNPPTRVDGSFTLLLPISATYQLDVQLPAQCDPQVKGEWNWDAPPFEAQVEVASREVSGVEIEVPRYRCRWRIFGRVMDAAGTGIADATVRATDSAGATIRAQTEEDGAFMIQATQAGEYHLEVDLGNGCFGYYASAHLVAERASSIPIQLSEANVTGLLLRVPRNYCRE